MHCCTSQVTKANIGFCGGFLNIDSPAAKNVGTAGEEKLIVLDIFNAPTSSGTSLLSVEGNLRGVWFSDPVLVKTSETWWKAFRSNLPTHRIPPPGNTAQRHQGPKNSDCRRPLARHRQGVHAHPVASPSGLEDVTVTTWALHPSCNLGHLQVLWALRGVADLGGSATAGWRDQRGWNLVKGGDQHQHLGSHCDRFHEIQGKRYCALKPA